MSNNVDLQWSVRSPKTTKGEKRKATEAAMGTKNPSNYKRARATQTEGTYSTVTSIQDSPLLKLPAELRNNVYEKIAEDTTGHLKSGKNGILGCSTAFPRVNGQVHREFLSIFALQVPKIVATTKDFDFGHVITFLNRLSEDELKTLPGTTQAPTRHIHVDIHLSRHADHYENHLTRWLNRLDHPTKRGSCIEATYAISGSSKEVLLRLATLLRRILRHQEEGRGKTEGRKTWVALKDAVKVKKRAEQH
ncbi:hypothetical protein LTR37_000539 [Vermiconidia calcicola]|uniref:Uncharacterized protein n=1 Tax=Vermiconidia calcicola TaxID=1690605 RepID=A0ACC3NX97_9PEZI|nr:hypothetical protein LTR37_000539 [Vermiconidia calcicola]